ncbi:MAG: GNAT family N-acetyltransferase [Clostridium sp.]|uniref:GNAT family N-acetyltransferase n=1 Tax=Clostridium sp. TaxID=1506 RepID=UPI00305AEF55
MELWDVYDKYREATGRTHERGNKMTDGDYHMVVHIWIINDRGEFLIQKRQPWKIGWPNMWDCATAGSAQQGDNSTMAVIREVKEELGLDINPRKLEPLFTVKFANGFDDIWIIRDNINIEDLKLQYEEVADARWATESEIREMIASGEFIYHTYIDYLFKLIHSKIRLFKATIEDSEKLITIQKTVFKEIYEKYQDHETSPVNQSLEGFKKRFDKGDYYKIVYEDNLVGSVFVYRKTPGVMRFHIINILNEYQNKGITQEVMERLETIYPEAEAWELDTILSEKRNCHVYEKMGYSQSGELQQINSKLTLVSYTKMDKIRKIIK